MNKGKKIFVQNFAGSISHQALDLMLEYDSLKDKNVKFMDSQKEAIQEASQNNDLAFVSVQNSITKNRLLSQTVKALQKYEISNILDHFRIRVEMCLFRSEKAVEKNLPMKKIVGTPFMLDDIEKWKRNREKVLMSPIELIRDLDKSIIIARKLIQNEYNNYTALLATEWTKKVYPELHLIEKGVQDTNNNYTDFILAKIVKRKKTVSNKISKDSLLEITNALFKDTN